MIPGFLSADSGDDKSSKVETLQKKDAKVLNIKKKMHFFDGTCAHEVRSVGGSTRFYPVRMHGFWSLRILVQFWLIFV